MPAKEGVEEESLSTFLGSSVHRLQIGLFPLFWLIIAKWNFGLAAHMNGTERKFVWCQTSVSSISDQYKSLWKLGKADERMALIMINHPWVNPLNGCTFKQLEVPFDGLSYVKEIGTWGYYGNGGEVIYCPRRD